MATRYSRVFTLKDIFNNKKLANKLPLINYKEKELENGKISRRTNAKTVNRQIFDTAQSAARPFYKPLKTTRSGDVMIIDGTLVGDYDLAVDSVYNAIKAKRSLLVWTANNADMIRDALKEAEKNKRTTGKDTKLFLRANSMQEIEGMTTPQLQALMSDIMDNIFFGDGFEKTQEKYGVKSRLYWGYWGGKKDVLFYKQRQLRWKYQVGDI